METPEQVLRQLKWIKWLTALIAWGFVVIAGSITWLALQFDSIILEDDSLFMAEVQSLLDAGKENAVLELVTKREQLYPKNVYVHWCRGLAHYRLHHFDEALKAMRQVHEQEPTWRESHTTPYITAIEEELAKKL